MPRAQRLASRIGWFAALWIAGVVTVATVAFAIRMLIA